VGTAREGAPLPTLPIARRSDPHAAGAGRADAVELGLLAGVVGGALAQLVALVEQLDLLELLEGVGERVLGLVELAAQFAGRALEVLAPPDRGLGVGRIGEMGRIVDAGAVLLGA